MGKEDRCLSLIGTLGNFDIYGQNVEFTFQKQAKFKTCAGKFFTLITVIILMTFGVIRLLKLVVNNDPLVSMVEMDSMDTEVDLFDLGYMFAIQAPDPKAGRIIANQVAWGRGKSKKRTKIDLVDCNELLPGGKHEGKSNNKFFNIENLATLGRTNTTTFLCPVGVKKSKLIGKRLFNILNLFANSL